MPIFRHAESIELRGGAHITSKAAQTGLANPHEGSDRGGLLIPSCEGAREPDFPDRAELSLAPAAAIDGLGDQYLLSTADPQWTYN
jgi:hypothetical protein